MSHGNYYPTMKGDEKKRVLARFEEQMRKWALPIPRVEPIVVSFGALSFDKAGLIEYWLANEAAEGYCGKFLFVFDGQTCPYHHHVLKHETFYILKGGVSMKVAGVERVLKEGELLVMPQGTDHSFTGRGAALLIEISKPCSEGDNIFEDKSIGSGGKY